MNCYIGLTKDIESVFEKHPVLNGKMEHKPLFEDIDTIKNIYRIIYNIYEEVIRA